MQCLWNLSRTFSSSSIWRDKGMMAFSQTNESTNLKMVQHIENIGWANMTTLSSLYAWWILHIVSRPTPFCNQVNHMNFNINAFSICRVKYYSPKLTILQEIKRRRQRSDLPVHKMQTSTRYCKNYTQYEWMKQLKRIDMGLHICASVLFFPSFKSYCNREESLEGTSMNRCSNCRSCNSSAPLT